MWKKIGLSAAKQQDFLFLQKTCFSQAIAKPQGQHQFKKTYKTVKLMFGAEARHALIKGVQRISLTAAITLGPGGRNVALEYDGGDPKITKDGVTVVKSIFEAKRENEMGSRMIKKIAGSTNTFAGDGTTTSTFLAHEMLRLGFDAVEVAGAHPIALKKGMEIALQVVLQFLQDIALPINTEKEIFDVCMVSSNNNTEIASIVAKTMFMMGLQGNVNIIESPTGRNMFNLVNGLIFERGFVSDAFVTENQIDQKVELELPLVLVVGNKITSAKDITPVMELCKKSKRPLVIFSEDMQQEPLSMMVYNNQKGNVSCVAVNLPWLANIQKEQLKDIAAHTGATLIDNDYTHKLSEITDYKLFGSAKKIVVDGYLTHIVGGSGRKEDIDDRITQIEEAIAQETSVNIKQVLRDRYSRLTAKIAEIEVGGGTEVERGENRDIIVDSLNSAKSAMQSGILPGGGVALYQASKLLESGLLHLTKDENERMGVRIMAKALKAPIRKVIENKTGVSAAYIIDQIDQSGDFFMGYDANKNKICDMMDAGVVDSFNVVRSVLQDSVSLAGLLITTECLVVKEKQYEPLPLQHYQERREFF